MDMARGRAEEPAKFLERAKALFAYDGSTGLFVRTTRQPKTTMAAGTVAGHAGRLGYISIRINGVSYMAHRLAWLFVHGEWPAIQIDHINGNRADNRIANLRSVSCSLNMQNQRKPRGITATGLLGVHVHSDGRFRAKICVNQKQIHIGVFDTAEAAHEAYLQRKRQIHSTCTI